jgi:hypothetical protein
VQGVAITSGPLIIAGLVTGSIVNRGARLINIMYTRSETARQGDVTNNTICCCWGGISDALIRGYYKGISPPLCVASLSLQRSCVTQRGLV